MIYEVNCIVPESRQNEFLQWLEGHIRQLLKLGGFEDATLSRLHEDERLQKGSCGFCVRYFLDSQLTFERYLSEFAPAMRADGEKRFGTDLVIYRRLLSAPLLSS